MIDLSNTKVEKEIFDEEYFLFLKNYFMNHKILQSPEYHFYGSKRVDSFNDDILNQAHIKLTEKAKDLFKSKTLMPSYAVFSEYSGEQAYLDKHKDIGPCTYTIDLCLYQKTQWPIYIEDKEYNFTENEGIVFYPNHQDHWRGDFPDKENNKVGIILFSYVEPDHDWWKIPEKMRPLLRNKVKPV